MEIENHEANLRRELDEKEAELQKHKQEIAKLKMELQQNPKSPSPSLPPTIVNYLEIWERRRRLLSGSSFTLAPDRLNLALRFGTSSMCPRAFEIVDEEVGFVTPNVAVHSSDGEFDTGNWWTARAWDHQKKVTIAVYCGNVGSVGSFGATLPYPSNHTAEVTTSQVQLFVAHVKGLGIHLVFTY